MTEEQEQEQRQCIECSKTLLQSHFSKSQWKKGRGNGRCTSCVQGSDSNGKAKTSFLLKAQQQSKPKKMAAVLPSPAKLASPKPITSTFTETLSLGPRPQKAVPCFDHLTVCSDWPQTKSGGIPAQQSAIFMPLLACVIGPVEGHCTAEQLNVAMQWWNQALPAWSRWVQALKEAGVPRSRQRLLNSARGKPNPLIPNVKGSHGTIPHCWGKLQMQELAKDAVVELELSACVICLYSQRFNSSGIFKTEK